MAEYTLHIMSLSPLLTHNPASMAIPKAVGTRGSNIPLPEVEAEAAVYRLADGQCAIPAIALRSAIIEAAGAWKAAGRRSSMKSVLSHIEVMDELLPLWNPDDGSPLTSYAIDRRRVRVQRAGVMRARPRFEHWGTTIILGYDEVLLTQPDIIREIANDAGRRFGVGDYRPQTKGWFGKFTVTDEAAWVTQLPLAAE
jgi:hypothetical protein